MKPQLKMHPCPDCGRPHHTPEDNRRLLSHFHTCAHCNEPIYYEYVVKRSVWEAAGMEYHGGVLHLDCLEEKLGRNLELDDFEGPIGPDDRHHGHSINDAIRWALKR